MSRSVVVTREFDRDQLQRCIKIRDALFTFKMNESTKYLSAWIQRVSVDEGRITCMIDGKSASMPVKPEYFLSKTTGAHWRKKYHIHPSTIAIRLEWHFDTFESKTPTFMETNLLALYQFEKESGDVALCPVSSLESDKKEAEAEARCDSSKAMVRTSRLRLMCASAVFKKILSNPMKEQKDGIIQIATCSLRIIDDMVYYLTTGILRHDADFLSLLKLSHMYELTTLNYACMDRLIPEVKAETFGTTKTAFDRYSFDGGPSLDRYTKLLQKLVNNKKMLAKVKEQGVLSKDWLAWSKVKRKCAFHDCLD